MVQHNPVKYKPILSSLINLFSSQCSANSKTTYPFYFYETQFLSHLAHSASFTSQSSLLALLFISYLSHSHNTELLQIRSHYINPHKLRIYLKLIYTKLPTVNMALTPRNAATIIPHLTTNMFDDDRASCTSYTWRNF
jgi:hypothetical protein